MLPARPCRVHVTDFGSFVGFRPRPVENADWRPGSCTREVDAWDARGYHASTEHSASLVSSVMLISCVAYQNGRKLADIPVADISEYVSRPDCFVWVAMFEPSREDLDEMAAEFGLHELAVDDARQGHQRPKIEEYGDSLFAVLHTVEKEKTAAGDEVLMSGEVDIFVGRNYVLSVRQRTKVGFSAVRVRAEREPELLQYGSGYVFYALMDNVVDRYFPTLDGLETELEKIEEQIFVRNTARSNIEALYALKQKLMVLKHAVDPLMEATGRLYGGRVPQICTGMGEYFRDVYDHLHRIHLSIEGIRDMLTTAIQVNLGMISLSENEVTKKLAAWAAIIAVPTMVAGIYGMNFKNMPELDWTYGYPVAVAVMVIVDIWLYFNFKKVKWL
jgi:magnesium transporter